jgi:hypothetical protein
MKRMMIVSALFGSVFCRSGVSYSAVNSGLPILQGAPNDLLKLSLPAPGYRPFFYYLNEVYDFLEETVLSHIHYAGLLGALLLFLACCAVYAAYRKFSATELKGDWMLDVAPLEKQWLEAGGSPDSIEIIKQQMRLGRVTYTVSREKITISGRTQSVSFPYDTLSVIGDITTGLVDERMVIIMWTSPKVPGRIISMRKANEREIFSSGEGAAHS